MRFILKDILLNMKHPSLDPSEPDYDDPYTILYTKKLPDSDIYYAAGWYAINFDKVGNTDMVKYSTLIKYGYEVPLKLKWNVEQG